MKRALLPNLLAAGAAVAALLLPVAASAQYIWLDEKGSRHYSDMPPPPSVPSNRILKQPGAPASAQQNPADEKPANAAKTAPTLAEQNAEFRKRRADQAEKEKKAADEAARAADKAKNCERAHDFQRLLDSGERIARTDKNGERTFLTDEQRARESRENRQTLADCK
ncbi:DUF4124 domain-containing protein [Noviherbaspirillum denitrificans]|uniref:DUF4124 domain-containing protein n=1 Tax=Noviherbaspirillum denitrificans TaxID=1968433 RepID=A0A254THP6_9BURK|nr:DUF4124 domain-containing protein [Noviherbaspirillum denitrificans]OWW22170.1 hypothetical protein AYR66_24410 [Noviherbaspirillum denitrificans]